MAGAIPSRILVHVAVPLVYAEDAAQPWVEGEPGDGPEPERGEPFACVIFPPSPGGSVTDSYRPRTVRVPTLLCNPTREIARVAAGEAPALVADHTPIVFGNETELLITAPELAAWTGGTTVRWQVDGEPQPFGPPGQVIGVQATIRQILG